MHTRDERVDAGGEPPYCGVLVVLCGGFGWCVKLEGRAFHVWRTVKKYQNPTTQQQQTTYAPSSPSRRASSSLVAWCNRGEAAASGEAALSASGDGAAAAAWTQVRRVLRTLYQ